MTTAILKAVVATGNPGKLAEIRALLRGCGIELLPQSDFSITPIEETGSTFRDNAVIKARHAANLSGLPAIADDSGLAVDVLDGRPGVRSARYAGQQASDDDNVDKLLGELAGVAPERRGATFRCVAVFLRTADDSQPLIGRGEWRGSILESRRGQDGFGYDPVFLPDGSDRSAAEMPVEAKNRVSHRGQAFRELAGLLGSLDAARQ